MRYVELIPGVQSSVLGFGCAPIMGSVGGAAARRALTVSLDAGITHFDLARSYGYGDAERFVGDFLQARRSELCLVTKFGIEANQWARLLKPVKPLFRALRGRRRKAAGLTVPFEMTQGATVADRFHRRLPITGESMRRSLEISLRALRTDYIDILLVHEPTGPFHDFSHLSAAAAQLVQEGKIRSWGVAALYPDILHWTTSPEATPQAQFQVPVKAEDYQVAKQLRGNAANILFSPLRRQNGRPVDEVLRSLWRDFPRSVVLCSMFTPKHIQANSMAAE